ncbi:J517_1871 family lipoprotein [Pseudomonas sp. NBRC 111134]|uniref:J517_1871 family lipoprotein n=1 Tax=Pseudomonas sp. NBRC 111134 TaxID=1661049 RepID=UPI000A9A749F|nr:J517_1871 family lipoprotein [Pseudomonas sp. NBRC 111134]
MRKLIIIGVVGLISGCVASSDIMNNNFPAVVVAIPPASMVGAWTGSMGPYSTTIKVEADGGGYMCYSWNGKDVLSRIKYSGSQIVVSDGSKLDVGEVTKSTMQVDANYYMGASYTMYKDDELKSASPYCSKNI